ncbi:MAG: hypothetical protein IPI49_22520 [Myxococcales bacterium]|nr:hypothetical protein [Myxococcales bacterium]
MKRPPVLAISLIAAIAVIAAFLATTVFATGQAHAQDGAPSATLERAIKLYEQEQWLGASIELKKVVDGDSGDGPRNKQRGEFFMGKALYQLHFYAGALSYFDKIVAAGDAHPYHAATLKWLAALSVKLPDTSGILAKIGTYNESALSDPSIGEAKDQLYFLLGRFFYSKGGDENFDKAISLFQQVARDSEYFIKAKFFEGVTHVRKYQGKAAIDAFKEILVIGQERPKQYAKADIETYEELARLQMGRVFYSTQQFDTSIKYYEKLPQDSADWTKSLFEASWAYFMKSLNSKALGNIHTLNAPYFEDEFYPESMLLKAVIYFKYCLYEQAEEAIADYNEKFQPLTANLDQLLAKYEDDGEFYGYVVKVLAGKGGLDESTQRLVMSVLNDRTLRKTFAWVDELQGELDLLAKQDKAWQTTKVAGELLGDLTLQKSLAEAQAGKVARDRVKRLAGELSALARDGSKIRFEILQGKGDKISNESLGVRVSAKEKAEPIIIDDEHFLWKFNGEYWKDELGYYRFRIRSRCPK